MFGGGNSGIQAVFVVCVHSEPIKCITVRFLSTGQERTDVDFNMVFLFTMMSH